MPNGSYFEPVTELCRLSCCHRRRLSNLASHAMGLQHPAWAAIGTMIAVQLLSLAAGSEAQGRQGDILAAYFWHFGQ